MLELKVRKRFTDLEFFDFRLSGGGSNGPEVDEAHALPSGDEDEDKKDKAGGPSERGAITHPTLVLLCQRLAQRAYC